MKPKLSVVCLCYNQVSFLEKAVASVFSQEGVSFEVLLVDDGSTDGSRELAEALSRKYSFAKVLLHEENLGNTKAFNQALQFVGGTYVIDFACDDMFLKGAFKRQVACLEKHPESGLLYSNALFMNEEGEQIGHQYPVNDQGEATVKVPTGDVFLEVLERSYINTPSMVMRKSWLDQLGGYNTSLVYEDFDIWLRGAQIAPFVYLDQVLVAKRIHQSNSSKYFMSVKGETYYQSTAIILEQTLQVVSSLAEKKALAKRCQYEGRNASFWNFGFETLRFKKILEELNFFDTKTQLNWGLFRVAGFFLRKKMSKI